ncbi:MAG: hypothetical protein Q7J42_10025 [Sulfuritalea sp.]|nr:hypothetical protein [Sulfuritalea sp.]
MKAMNEFESVLAIAALILAVCATMDIPLAGGPNAAAGRSGSDYPGYSVMPSLEAARQEATDTAASDAAEQPLAMASREADNSSSHAPAMRAHRSRQKLASW